MIKRIFSKTDGKLEEDFLLIVNFKTQRVNFQCKTITYTTQFLLYVHESLPLHMFFRESRFIWTGSIFYFPAGVTPSLHFAGKDLFA